MAIYSTAHGRLSRRQFLQLAGIAGTTVAVGGLLSACSSDGSSTEQPSSDNGSTADLPQTDSVIIGVYSGDWEKSINSAALDGFTDDSGLDVQIVSGADAEWLTKVQAANGNNVPFDLLILQPDSIQKLVDGNLLEVLTEDRVPALAQLAPSISERFTVDGKLYAAGFSMGQLGIAYRTDLVSNPPESWSDLWKSEYAGQLGISPLTYSAGLQFFWALTKDGDDIDGAFTQLESLKQNVIAYPDGAGTLQTLIQRGDIALVPFWDGRAFAWQEQGLPIGFAYPTDGPVAAIASWVIPRNAPNLANAYTLLDFLCSADVQARYAALSFYGMSNNDTEYAADFLEKAQVGEDYYNQLSWVDYEVATENLTDWSSRWQAIFG